MPSSLGEPFPHLTAASALTRPLAGAAVAARPARDAVPASSARSSLLRLLAVAASAALVALLLWRVDPGAATGAAIRVGWLPLLAAVLLNVPCTLLRAWRSRQLVAHAGVRVPIGRMTSTQLFGQLMSWLTPAATGDLVRPYIWRRDDAVPVRDGVSAVLYERVVSFLLLCAIGAPMAAVVIPRRGEALTLLAVAVAMAVVTALVVGVARGWPAGLQARVPARLRAALDRLRVLAGAPRLALSFVALTLGIFALSGLQVVLLTAGLGHPAGLWLAIAAYCLSQAAGSLSALPFGLGVTDAIVVALLVGGGLDVSTAAATMLLSRLAVTLPLGVAGAGAWVLLGVGRRRPVGA